MDSANNGWHPFSSRQYYERLNYLIQQYLYIDKLLDSSLPHDLLNEYNDMPSAAARSVDIPTTISEEQGSLTSPGSPNMPQTRKVKRTPKDIYRSTESTPLLAHHQDNLEEGTVEDGPKHEIPSVEDEQVDHDAPIVTLAIYINFAANAILLAGKIAVIATVPSVSVLASMVDALLDFLSTVIVWLTTYLISRRDHYLYPVGRRTLEPLGVLVFSVIMITSFTRTYWGSCHYPRASVALYLETARLD